ncbi:hypothetical protein AJ78_00292 [Emergomyces pasteurianus Ep9510]|uniref:Uncharacterized protein n=1 Tax=Emergomyces pasteurianus Ep9510 TaxID=1447872 RepID=A0A1J9PTR7_9EURO|nr:hypothetical protein AJ78_00292 [Emergomyces pasteurianus Ep9510]
METTYSVEVTRSIPSPEASQTTIYVPGSITYTLRIHCSNATPNEDPFKDMRVSCKMVTKDEYGELIEINERFYTIGPNLAYGNREVSGPTSIAMCMVAEIKEAGETAMAFCIKRRVKEGEYELMPGPELQVPVIRGISVGQLRKAKESETCPSSLSCSVAGEDRS